MNNTETKTTIVLERNLLDAAKRKALEENTTLKEILRQALLKELGRKKRKAKKVEFGQYDLGKIKGNLSRKETYDFL